MYKVKGFRRLANCALPKDKTKMASLTIMSELSIEIMIRVAPTSCLK